MADPATKKILTDLANDDALNNKVCVDCGAPRPQWASISFAIFICLQCAGTHRGFGVHVSFVRSVSMDAWQDEQLHRMKLGGNAPFMQFLRDYGPEGGYTEGMSIHGRYHCWAATQYREKLTAAVEDQPWSPSSPRPSSAQGLRKSRTSARSSPAPGSHLRQDSSSPGPSGSLLTEPDKVSSNEAYFTSLGELNAARPDHLLPSQGGRYAGFGNTPESEMPSQTGELQTEAVKVLSRGWSIFTGAMAAVSENVVKPGIERMADPELREKVGGYVSAASQKAAAAAGSANAWSKAQFGVDVGESVGTVVDKVRTTVVGHRPPSGYEAVGHQSWDVEEEGTSALYQHADDDDFFKDNGGWQDMVTAKEEERPAVPPKKNEDWDEWKDF